MIVRRSISSSSSFFMGFITDIMEPFFNLANVKSQIFELL